MRAWEVSHQRRTLTSDDWGSKANMSALNCSAISGAGSSLNTSEQPRVVVLNQLEAGALVTREADQLLGISERSVRRLRSGYRDQGALRAGRPRCRGQTHRRSDWDRTSLTSHQPMSTLRWLTPESKSSNASTALCASSTLGNALPSRCWPIRRPSTGSATNPMPQANHRSLGLASRSPRPYPSRTRRGEKRVTLGDSHRQYADGIGKQLYGQSR